MSRRNWKTFRPNSVTEALRGLKDHGIERHNLSVERQADRIAESADLLYKWHATGRMPVTHVIAYEAACGAHFLTQYLASAAGKLLVDIPTGRRLTPVELAELQGVVAQAVTSVLNFYLGKVDRDEALQHIDEGMAALAWHRANVAKADTPELELGQ